MGKIKFIIGLFLLALAACNSSRSNSDQSDTTSRDTSRNLADSISKSVDTTKVNSGTETTNPDTRAIEILKKLFPYDNWIYHGFTKSGYVRGEAGFTISFGNFIVIKDNLLNNPRRESGLLENFEITEDGIENTIKIFADWNTGTNSSQGARFCLMLSPDYPKNLYFEIRGDANANWASYAYLELNDDQYNNVKQILASSAKNIWEGKYTNDIRNGDINNYGSMQSLSITKTSDKKRFNWELSSSGYMVDYTIAGYGLINSNSEMELHAERVIDGNFMGKSGELEYEKPLLKLNQKGKDLTIIDFDQSVFDFDNKTFKKEK
jgi:hypothetical protein